jgi:hypothetical protein
VIGVAAESVRIACFSGNGHHRVAERVLCETRLTGSP